MCIQRQQIGQKNLPLYNARFFAQVSSLVKASPFEKPGAIAAFVLGSIHQGVKIFPSPWALCVSAPCKQPDKQICQQISQQNRIKAFQLESAGIVIVLRY